MLLKISKRSTRRTEESDCMVSPREPHPLVVHRAPDLVRWCDFSTPFPAVASGGYTRYYLYAGLYPKDAEAPGYSPVLSQDPCSPSDHDGPSTSSLFRTPSPEPRPPTRSLAIIHEASMESMDLCLPPPALAVPTNVTPRSLRHKHRRLLRTPSIERDFAVHGRRFFSSSLSVNEFAESPDVPSLHHSTHSRSSSSDSSAARSDSSDSFSLPEFPLTPSTSIGSGCHFAGMLGDALKSSECLDDTSERPGSWASYNTAKSDFSDT